MYVELNTKFGPHYHGKGFDCTDLGLIELTVAGDKYPIGVEISSFAKLSLTI